jgi:hypothetical protein
MLPNAFIGKATRPTDAELAAALGPAKTLWDQLVAGLAVECDVTVQEWNSYSRKAGWSLRLKRKERTILWVGPCRGSFRVAVILGDKAVQAARQSRLPKSVIRMINEAKRYVEGTGVRIEVKKPKDIELMKQLAAIKLAH